VGADSWFGVGSPEGVDLSLHPAGPVPRLLALSIDLLLGLLLVGLVATGLILLQVTGAWIIYLSSFVVFTFGMVVCELALGGASPGKRVLGLQVVMSDGRPVTLPASVLRNLLRFPDSTLALGWLVPLVAPGFRRLGDLVADTVVVYRSHLALRSDGSPAEVPGLVPLAPQRPLGPEAVWAAVEFGRRWDEFGPGLRRELATDAGDLYRRNPDSASPELTLRAVSAWYRGRR